jgi:hypothetical protein
VFLLTDDGVEYDFLSIAISTPELLSLAASSPESSFVDLFSSGSSLESFLESTLVALFSGALL